MDFSHIAAAAAEVADPMTLLVIMLGVFFGIIAGSIPGFTFTMALVLAFPFTFAMGPIPGLALMIGIYIGGLSGGLIAGTLLGIPGTPSSVATIFDGYPMTKNGQPARALGIGIAASVIGTILGALVLFLLGPVIGRFTLNFGPWEIFSLVLFALTLVAGLSGKHLVKGLIAGALGLLIAMIGVAPTGQLRFNFDNPQLSGGLDAIPVLIGLFAVSQLLINVEESRLDNRGALAHATKIRMPVGQVIRDMWREKVNVGRSSMIGTFVGTLPAAGAESANFISYDRAKKAQEKKDARQQRVTASVGAGTTTPRESPREIEGVGAASPRGEEYGKGHPGGIVASEASNSSVAGGAFIPTISLGIPGDVAQAIMMGALILHGIAPGPGLFDRQPVLVNSIYLAIVVAAVGVLIIQALLLPFLARVTLVPKAVLVPSVLVLTAVGAFALNNRIFDIWLVVVFGIIGYLLVKLSVPLPPMILGLILGGTLEENLLRALQIDPQLSTFLTRPISAVFLLLAVGSIAFALYRAGKGPRRAPTGLETQGTGL
ncbi:tripartite tricarboxylate transporter permease [Nesterenkonia flava]|uniref:Tripartite tricarboxylate transporter permease n=1 Tax=Nesterenkonia flava TaxID=469799 RepID=A0ABU1FWB2_9MICC|nr:tripartite tricarboxylate transporter permease [Nesterenkonia flava]MDR5712770.1 tripartite tricarboxylate transporter permease [Nesterenkonia flava]